MALVYGFYWPQWRRYYGDESGFEGMRAWGVCSRSKGIKVYLLEGQTPSPHVLPFYSLPTCFTILLPPHINYLIHLLFSVTNSPLLYIM